MKTASQLVLFQRRLKNICQACPLSTSNILPFFNLATCSREIQASIWVSSSSCCGYYNLYDSQALSMQNEGLFKNVKAIARYALKLTHLMMF